MEQASPADADVKAAAQAACTSLEGQLREMYGRVAYTHKTHEKMADRYVTRYKRIKTVEIALSALSSGSLLFAVLEDSTMATIIGALLSTLLLGLTLYFKEAALGESAQKHTEVASKLWAVREALLSLLTDMHDGRDPASIRVGRDELNAALVEVYRHSPRTNGDAYAAAQKALKHQEELFFSDSELDHLLPSKLRRGSRDRSS
jgi:hypothetical protein